MTSLLDWAGWHNVIWYSGVGTAACLAATFAALLLRRSHPAANANALPAAARRLLYFRTLRIATALTLAWGLFDSSLLPWNSGILAVLFISALAVCYWDRRMCGRELLYCLAIAILLIFVTPAGLA